MQQPREPDLHACCDRFTKHGDGAIDVPRRAPNARSGELHRTVPEAIHLQGSAGKREVPAENLEVSLFMRANVTCQ